jgi:hypothetical protein
VLQQRAEQIQQNLVDLAGHPHGNAEPEDQLGPFSFQMHKDASKCTIYGQDKVTRKPAAVRPVLGEN